MAACHTHTYCITITIQVNMILQKGDLIVLGNTKVNVMWLFSRSRPITFEEEKTKKWELGKNVYTCVTQKSSNSDWQMYSSQPFMFGMLSEVGGREIEGGRELEGGWVGGEMGLGRSAKPKAPKCTNGIAKILQILVKLLTYLCGIMVWAVFRLIL